MIQSVPEQATFDNKEPVENEAVDHILDLGNGQKLILSKREDNLLGGMSVPRRFSKEGVHPYDEIEWERRDVVIMDYATGKPNFERKGVEVPASWADNAVRITVSKYLFGNEPDTPEYEDSLKQVFDRISNTYTVWGWKHGYFASPEDALRYNHELKALQIHQFWAPNSPVWFNVGLWEQWRWGRPDLRQKFARRGNKAFKAFQSPEGEMEVRRFANAYEHPQAAACFLLGIEDSMESILDHYKAEGGIFSSGSGAGMNISTLRSSYEPISGKGRSSGPVAFDRGLDASAGAIKSGGKTRRAARMLILSSDHPDIFKFVNAKNNQEEIGKIILREHNVFCELVKLARQKQEKGTYEEKIAADFILSLPQVNDRVYSSQMDALLYGETLAFQNSNHSVSFKGDFWKAYSTKGEYSTRWVSDPTHVQDTFKASRLLDEIVRCIWNNAEPGVHNNDFINLWNPAKSDGEIVTSNPCSEYLHLNHTSCNLSSFNLYAFYDTAKKTFDIEGFRHAVRLAMIAADLNVEEGGFPIPEIAVGTSKYRTTGLGYANLGGLLMAMGIPYDSDRGRYIASVITSFLTSTAFGVSFEMGKELGAYPRFEATKGDLSEVLHLHRAAQKLMERVPQLTHKELRQEVENIYAREKRNLPSAQGITGREALEGYLGTYGETGPAAFAGLIPAWIDAMCASASEQWDSVCLGAEESRQIRNNFVTCIAPTGTISAAMGVYDKGTTSAEPDYTLVKYKQLSGGGSLKMFNSLALEALATLGYSAWEVREAALEVAGLDGLYVACDQSMEKVVNHLRSVPQHESDRTRVALQRLLETGVLILDARHIAEFCEQGRKGELSGESLAVCNGTSSTEFISWIRPEHQAVFDCSATNGAGTRSIAPEGHIRMLGALQPFISGATSKTVNLPYTAKEVDILRCIVGCHDIGVKCTAFFRAESKAESVFSLDTPEGRKFTPPEVWKKLVESVSERTRAIVTDASKPRRTRLPGRRTGQIVKFRIDNLDGYLQIGIYPDGRCGEVFGTVGQGGSFANGMFTAFCKSFSTSLQYGVPLKELTESFRYMSFDPSGFCKVGDATPDGGASEIHTAKSVIDLMVQILDWLFPDGYLKDLGGCDATLTKHPRGETDANSVSVSSVPFCFTSVQSAKSDNDGWGRTDVAAQTAMSCPRCHSLAYVRDGHCRTCRNCGYKDGGCGE
jgi:ribonucleoside-diphosphate reductase alpha chain